jgi:hypothetical protein
MAMTLAFLGYFALLLLLLVVRSRTPTHPAWFLLRSLFPNWRFYHAPGLQPRLMLSCEVEGHWSGWLLFKPRLEWRWSQLLFNPEVNLALLEQTLFDHLASAVEDNGSANSVEDLVAYRLVARLARLQATAMAPAATRVQFRICLQNPGQALDPDQDLLLQSPMLAL